MSDYLRKYVGKYRVLAEYDLDTNDFIKDADGDIDKSIDNLYIKCAKNVKIKHCNRNILWAYIPNKTAGKNILRRIYQDHIGSDLPKKDDTYLTKLCDELIKHNVLVDAEVLDYEVDFSFVDDDMNYIAKLLKPQTSGAKIQPYSVKNLPKSTYKIPKECEIEYKELCKKLPQRQLKGKMIVDGIFIKNCNNEFLKKKKLINTSRMKDKEFIHNKGLWKDYIKFLKTKEI